MQLATYKKRLVIITESTEGNPDSYEIYQFNTIDEGIPISCPKKAKELKLVNPNRLSPSELRKYILEMAKEIIILNDILEQSSE